MRQAREIIVAIIDGPYDEVGLSKILARPPIKFGSALCSSVAGPACDHGTFIMGVIGARRDAPIPGLCPDCQIMHCPLFVDESDPSASVEELSTAIERAVAAGALIINLSLAIVGEEATNYARLSAALNYAEESGAIVVVAAGNQGRLATGQILAHPATIPVAAVDKTGRLLPECNFGPLILRRGVAALGRHIAGYAPGARLTTMSGTSVATAIATGIIADVWSARSNVSAREIFLIISRLAPSELSGVPWLNRDVLLQTLDRILNRESASMAVPNAVDRFRLQGGRVMTQGYEQPAPSNYALSSGFGQPVVPAVASGNCACGNAGGTCTCNENGAGLSGFVYAIGTIEAECPSIAIEREMQLLARHLNIADPDPRPNENRAWQHAVLSGAGDKKVARYLARQLSWRLTIEDYTEFLLSPRYEDFDDLIDCLGRPKFSAEGDGRRKKAGQQNLTPVARPQDLDVIVGKTGARTSAGYEAKIDHVFTIKQEQLSLPGVGGAFSQLADNRGLTDEDRAYNYLIARYAIELENLREIDKEFELAGVPAIRSRLSGDNRRVVRVIYTFKGKSQNTPAQRKYFVRVDVTEPFPYIVTPWTRYLERGE